MSEPFNDETLASALMPQDDGLDPLRGYLAEAIKDESNGLRSALIGKWGSLTAIWNEVTKRAMTLSRKGSSVAVRDDVVFGWVNDIIIEGDITIRPMSSVEDFISTGNSLHMCVGRMNYDKKMSERKSACLMVFVSGRITECCEIEPKGKVLQLYGDHDMPSEFHGAILSLCSRYASERKWAVR